MKPSAAIGKSTAYWNYREIGWRSALPPRVRQSGRRRLHGGKAAVQRPSNCALPWHRLPLSHVRTDTMSQNVFEFLWKRLSECGLTRANGYPGDGAGSLDMARRTLTPRHRARDDFLMGGEQQ